MLASPPSTTTLPMMAPATKKELEDKMQQVGSELQKIELELQKCVEVRQRLDSQMNENDQVKKEFAVLKPENAVYKMVGPVLLRQDQQEAKTNVDKRLEFIKSEIRRVEEQLKDINTRSERKRLEVVAIQEAAQAQAQQQQVAAT